jgi:threonine/homoserine/homoserine lactone efflux protein
VLQPGFMVTAVGLGITYAATPGAVNTEAIRRGVTRGARSALLVQCGSLFGDSLWALLALTGVAIFAHHLAIQIVLGIAGGCFLLRMAWLALHEAIIGRQAIEGASPMKRGDLGTGIVFGVANPVSLAFWSGLGSGVAASGIGGIRFVLFFFGFFVGAGLWCIIFAAAIRWGRRWLRPAVFRWIDALCALILGYLGIRVLWLTLQAWLERQIPLALAAGHGDAALDGAARRNGLFLHWLQQSGAPALTSPDAIAGGSILGCTLSPIEDLLAA